MNSSEDGTKSVRTRITDVFLVEEDLDNGPRLVVAVLALIATALVALSMQSALQTGHAALAGNLLATVGLFVATIAVFEIGRHIGTNSTSP